MIRQFEWDVARRYLRGRSEDGFVSATAGFAICGISLGVAVLIIVMSVMNGFQATLINQLVGLRGHILVQSPIGEIRDFDELTKSIERVEFVVDADH